MKASEIRSKTPEALDKALDELRKAQFNLRMQERTSQSFKCDQFRKNRRDIARVLTVLNERTRDMKKS